MSFASESKEPQSPDSGDTIIPIPDEYPLPGDGPPGSFEEPSSPWLLKHCVTRKDNFIEKAYTRSLEQCPRGYPRLAAFHSSESSFSLYRGFSYLHSRVLLDLQDDIANLEKELDEKDDADEKGDSRRLQSRDVDNHAGSNDGLRRRSEILSDLKQKLVDYDELLIKARELQAFQRPSNRDYRSVRTVFHNEKFLVDEEQDYIRCREDIVTLRQGREWAGFDGWVESTIHRFDCKFIRWLFCTPELLDKTGDREHLFYYSASRIERLVGVIMTTIIFILLVLPVIVMYKLTSSGTSQSTFQAIGVLIVFTLLFSAAMSLLTKARRHELFAASAAYCAVLVVFISNFSGSGVKLA